MPVQRSCPVLAMSIASAVGLVIFLFFFAHLGGLLNRSRGGYVNLRNPANNSVNLDYWSAEVVKNLLFAVPTGIIVVRGRRIAFNIKVTYMYMYVKLAENAQCFWKRRLS